jgi:site-specific DNA recombinase
LRGFVTCGGCGKALTAYWAKGRNKRYPYYECFNKGCDQRRKSIKRDQLETEFETLIKHLRPAAAIMTTVAAMFRDIWNMRNTSVEDKRQENKRALTALNTKNGGHGGIRTLDTAQHRILP